MSQVVKFLAPTRALQAFGLNPFSFDKNFKAKESRKLKFYSLFLIGCSLLMLLKSYSESDMFLKRETSGIADVVEFLQMVGFRLSLLTTLIEALVHQKMLINFFELLEEVDETIQKLNDNKNSDLYKRNCTELILLTATCFYIGFPVASLVVQLSFLTNQENQFSILSYWFSATLPYLVVCLRFYQIINFVCLIKKRFDVMNKALSKVNLRHCPITFPVYKENHRFYKSDFNCVKRSKTIKDYEQLILFRELCNKIYALSTIIDDCFGLSSLANIGMGFCVVTSRSYFIFITMLNFTTDEYSTLKVLSNLLASLPHVVNIIAISAACHFTVHASEKTALIVHKIDHDSGNDQQNLLLQQFSLQLLHERIKFTAFGFFDLDLSLLFAIVASITTYLVILIQFYLSENGA